MKGRLIMPLAVLLILVVFSGLPVSAEEVRVFTRVPDSHEVEISVIGDGYVETDGSRFKNGILTVPRQKSQKYVFSPEYGYELKKLYYNGKDVTALVREGSFIADRLTSDGKITVIFGRQESPDRESGSINPEDDFFLTGESDRSVVFIVIFLVSCGAIAVCLIIRGKRERK